MQKLDFRMMNNIKYWNFAGITHLFTITIQIIVAISWIILAYLNLDLMGIAFSLGMLGLIPMSVNSLIKSVERKGNIFWSLFPKYVLRFNDLADNDGFISSNKIQQIREQLTLENIPYEYRFIDRRKLFPPSEWSQILIFKNYDDMVMTKLQWSS